MASGVIALSSAPVVRCGSAGTARHFRPCCVAEAWIAIEPLQHAPGLERLLAAALLRGGGKTGAHLACLAEGAQTIPRERRRARDATVRLAQLDAIAAAARLGLEQHDRGSWPARFSCENSTAAAPSPDCRS
jgi:Protein of unknown function (DUF1612)